MRNLPSLVQPPVLSSFPSLPPISEGMEPTLDSCLPELLACDLEVSKGVFAAKNMSAGAPASFVSFDDKLGKMAVPHFGRTVSPSPYPTIPPRKHSLRTIREARSMVSFLDQRGSTNYDATSDSESTSDTDSFAAMEAPSIPFRSQSITTAPTSVASTQRKVSPHNSPRLSRERSWIDGDSEYEAQLDPTIDRLACLSPRPPTPPEQSSGSAKVSTTRETRRHSHTMLQHKSFSASCTPSRSPERRLSIRSEEAALRRSASPRVDSYDGGSPTTFNLAPFSSISNKRRHPEFQEPLSPLTTTPPPPEVGHHNMANLYQVRTLDSRLDEDAYSGRSDHFVRPQTVYIQPSPPPSPLPSVQSWLCNSSQPHASQFANDELAKAVPLPPDIIETLRVSIACFPETMLLTCSLTIETIRSYAKKVRHPVVDVLRSPLFEPLQQTTPRKSIWKKVVSYRRGSPRSGHRRSGSGASDNAGFRSASSSSLEIVKPWAPLQQVFGNTSDYLCDALYAHIVAYNYISALVPRSPLAKSRRNSQVPGDMQHDDIPKKAASLLGLSSAVDFSAASVPGLIKTIGNPFLKEVPSSQAALSANYENAIRDIQSGLMRCIARLVATAKLVAESGTGEERLVEVGASEVDMLLTRSLCEVVRLTEENAPGL